MSSLFVGNASLEELFVSQSYHIWSSSELDISTTKGLGPTSEVSFQPSILQSILHDGTTLDTFVILFIFVVAFSFF